MKKKSRNSSFELLKVIAIICILFSHSIPTERIEYTVATDDMWLFFVMLFRQLGSVGNAIFTAASTWFLVDNDKTDYCKARRIVADNQIISITFLVLMFGGGYFLPYNIILMQLFPFFFGTLWFITCYVMYYCLHGFVNKALCNSELNIKLTLIVIIIVDCIIFVYQGLFINELFIFIMLHVFTFCLKKYINRFEERKLCTVGICLLVFGITGWLLSAIVFNFIGVNVPFIGERFSRLNNFYNPFILSMAYGGMIVASCKSFKSKIINIISSYSLYIYIITDNQLLRIYVDSGLYDIFCNVFGTSSSGCFVFTTGYMVVKFVVGLAISILYKHTLGRLVSKMVEKEYKFIVEKLSINISQKHA